MTILRQLVRPSGEASASGALNAQDRASLEFLNNV